MPFLVGNNKGVSVPIADQGLGHNFEKAPDGHEYFAILGPSLNLVRSIRNLLEAQRIYLSYPAGRGNDQAAAIAVIIQELETSVHASGVSTASFAEDRARTILHRKIVRPATPKSSHLADAIIARAIRSTSEGSWGAVGIGDIASLDQHIYWKAIEFGSTHLVGHEVRGFFENGGVQSAPSGGRFRQDPIFVPGQGPKMIVTNPIQGKHFLTQATFDALDFRYNIWRGVERAAVAQTRRVRVATAGDLAGIPFSGTVGGFSKLARYRK